MKERLIAGIDLGSSTIRLAVGQISVGADKREQFSLIGAIETPSQGISRGSVSALEDAVSSISSCLEQTERQIGLPVSEVYMGLGGPFSSVQSTKGVIGVSRADGEIRSEDVHRALESARALTNPANYEILHILPRNFIVDGQGGIKDPVGMQGIRLEVDAHVIQGLSTPVRNLTKAVLRTGVDISELVFAPLATASAVLTPRQKDLGVVLINLGAATTSMAVYEEGELLHAAVLPIGSDHITSDIAIGLRTSLEIAEQFKRSCVSAVANQIDKREELDLRDLGAEQSEIVSTRYVSGIVQARVEEIFEKVEQELQKIERSGMLPVGALLTGGGVKLRGVVETAKNVLRLPVAIGICHQPMAPLSEAAQDPAFSTAIGLVLWGFENERTVAPDRSGSSGRKGGKGFFGSLASPIKMIFKSFIP